MRPTAMTSLESTSSSLDVRAIAARAISASGIGVRQSR